MFILTAAALLLAGVIAGSILARHWESIRQWLNNDAANAVEKALGYKVRGAFLKAVSTVDKVFRIINGKRVAATISQVINPLSNGSYARTEMLRYDDADELGQAFLDEQKVASNVIIMDYRQ